MTLDASELSPSSSGRGSGSSSLNICQTRYSKLGGCKYLDVISITSLLRPVELDAPFLSGVIQLIQDAESGPTSRWVSRDRERLQSPCKGCQRTCYISNMRRRTLALQNPSSSSSSLAPSLVHPFCTR